MRHELGWVLFGVGTGMAVGAAFGNSRIGILVGLVIAVIGYFLPLEHRG